MPWFFVSRFSYIIGPSKKPTLDDLEQSVRSGIPVITAIQAWTNSEAKGFFWNSDWKEDYYVIVIGLDGTNVYAAYGFSASRTKPIISTRIAPMIFMIFLFCPGDFRADP